MVLWVIEMQYPSTLDQDEKMRDQVARSKDEYLPRQATKK